MDASVGAPLLASEPLAVDEVGTGKVGRRRRGGEELDRLEVQGLGVVTGAQCPRAGQNAGGPRRAGRVGSFRETRESLLGQRRVTPSHCHFDHVRERDAPVPRWIGEKQGPRRRQCLGVTTHAEMKRQQRVVRDVRQRPRLRAVCDRSSEGGTGRERRRFVASPRAELELVHAVGVDVPADHRRQLVVLDVARLGLGEPAQQDVDRRFAHQRDPQVVDGEQISRGLDEVSHPGSDGDVIPDIESGEEPEKPAPEELLGRHLVVALRVDGRPQRSNTFAVSDAEARREPVEEVVAGCRGGLERSISCREPRLELSHRAFVAEVGAGDNATDDDHMQRVEKRVTGQAGVGRLEQG